MNKRRVFLAINLPEEVRSRLVAVQQKLARAVPGNAVRWTSPVQLHLTLKFLGHLPEETVSRISAEAQSVCGRLRAFQVNASDVGFFPNANHPRIVWAGIEGLGLADLQPRLEAACCAITAQPEENRFKGHVTLGRVKSLTRTDAGQLGQAVQSQTNHDYRAWTVHTVELMQSELSSEGSIYSVLSSFHHVDD